MEYVSNSERFEYWKETIMGKYVKLEAAANGWEQAL